MIAISFLLSLFVIFCALLVSRGLCPFLLDTSAAKDLRYLSIGISWITISVMLRSVYWGVLYLVVKEHYPVSWHAWSSFIYGTRLINPLFDILHVIGFIYILKAFLAMVPEDEREYWSIFRAPFYPDKRMKGLSLKKILRQPRKRK